MKMVSGRTLMLGGLMVKNTRSHVWVEMQLAVRLSMPIGSWVEWAEAAFVFQLIRIPP